MSCQSDVGRDCPIHAVSETKVSSREMCERINTALHGVHVLSVHSTNDVGFSCVVLDRAEMTYFLLLRATLNFLGTNMAAEIERVAYPLPSCTSPRRGKTMNHICCSFDATLSEYRSVSSASAPPRASATAGPQPIDSISHLRMPREQTSPFVLSIPTFLRFFLQGAKAGFTSTTYPRR